MTCLSPRVFVKRFYEDSTSNNTKHMAVVVFVIITTEIKRTCTYSQGAQESSTEKKKKKESSTGLFSSWVSHISLFSPLLWPYCYLRLLLLPSKTRKCTQQTPKAEMNAAEETSWQGQENPRASDLRFES